MQHRSHCIGKTGAAHGKGRGGGGGGTLQAYLAVGGAWVAQAGAPRPGPALARGPALLAVC